MDLKIDFAFNQLFGNKKNKKITVVFVSEIIEQSGWGRIKDITFIDSKARGEYVDHHESRLNILVVTVEDQWIDVEILFTDKEDIVERSLCSWAGVYRKPLKKSIGSKKFRPIISINILNTNLFEYSDRFHTIYHLYENEERFKLTDMVEFHFIEMEKLISGWKEDKLDPWNDILVRWMLMLGMVDHRNDKIYLDIYQELEHISLGDETLRDALSNWEELSLSQEKILAYESRIAQL